MAGFPRAVGLPLAAVLVIVATVSAQGINTPPANEAARYGNQGRMRCQVTLASDNLEWSFYPNGTTTGVRVYYSVNGDTTEFPNDYTVPPSGDRDNGIYDLTILNSRTDMAGIYKCWLVGANIPAEANFVTVSAPTCSRNPSSTEVTEGSTVTLTCSVEYTGYKTPSLRWTYVDGELPSVATKTGSTSTIVGNISAQYQLNDEPFTCDVFFQSDQGDTLNPPVYNDSCMTSFFVQHGATDIELSPDPEPGSDVVVMAVGETINCSASGRPVPSYDWRKLDGEVGEDIYMGQNLLILSNWDGYTLEYECRASNTLSNGQPSETSMSIRFRVEGGGNPDDVQTAGVEPWVIAIAVIVPIVVIALAVGLGCYFYQKSKKKRPPPPVHDYTDVSAEARTGPGPTVIPRPHVTASYNAPATMGGMPVYPPMGTTNPQQTKAGKDSPGYADLGIKQFGSANPGLDISVDYDPNPGNRTGNSAVTAQMRGSQGSLANGRTWQNVADLSDTTV